MTKGQIVFVKAGRDAGKPMVVLEVLGDYILLADGRRRKLEKPKRKKIKHVQRSTTIVSLVPECGRALQDADIRKMLREVGGWRKTM